jgi:hypothetical protein
MYQTTITASLEIRSDLHEASGKQACNGWGEKACVGLIRAWEWQEAEVEIAILQRFGTSSSCGRRHHRRHHQLGF